MPLEQVGYAYGLAIAIGGAPGSVLGGLLADRLIRHDARWTLWFPAIAYAAAIPTGLAMLMTDDSTTALVLNGLYAFIVYANNGPLWAAVFVLFAPTVRATTSAITLLVAGSVGLALGPVFVGLISDGLMPSLGSASLRAALILVACCSVFVIAFLLIASRSLLSELPKAATARDRA
jgi:MFS family permease